MGIKYIWIITVVVMSSFLAGATIGNANAASVDLTWEAVTENVDGTPIDDLAGYHIYMSTEASTYDQPLASIEPTVSPSYTVDGVEEGTYYFVVTAFDDAGNISDYSNEVSTVIEDAVPPVAPKNLNAFVVQIQVVVGQ